MALKKVVMLVYTIDKGEKWKGWKKWVEKNVGDGFKKQLG
jgi:hypothetical protein